MTDDVIFFFSTQIRCRLLPLCSLVILREGEAERILIVLRRKEKDVELYAHFVLDDPLQHGLANSFSSALAVYLSQDEPMDEALQHARGVCQNACSKEE